MNDLDMQELMKIYEQGYGFYWKGKGQAVKDAENNESEHIDYYDGNLYIEGDNLVALKRLQRDYSGKMKMIYIDPPYNTKKKFIYNDNFKKPKKDSLSEGDRLHSNWLNMMYPRLKVARDLLADDGVMFISIDDREEGNLKKLCDEIFGEENFEKIVWKKKSGAGNTEKILGVLTESIFCVFKDKRIGVTNYRELERKYSYEDEKGKYNLEGIEKTNLGTYERPTMLFGIIDPKTGKEFFPSKDMRWTLGKDTVEKYLREGKLFFDYKNQKVKLIKRECDYEASQNVFLNLLDNHGSLKSAKNYLEEKLKFNRETFDTPKPVELIKQLLEIGSKKDSIILDFFSGSATTAHAVMQLNAEDGGNRKFIMVQLPEEVDEKSEAYKFLKENNKPTNICEIGKERIRRAGQRIKTDETLLAENREKLDTDFKAITL